MASPAVPSAATRVFQTTELLEKILLFMFDRPSQPPRRDIKAMRALFRSQRGDQNFKQMIEKSSPLQSAMWFSSALTQIKRTSYVEFNPFFAGTSWCRPWTPHKPEISHSIFRSVVADVDVLMV
ncbi:hypothetical protein AC579_7246 [Pseudocercospora musae]|uniref:Uncharacterized protein n=1 Tax=Pseudocercospora musae TaxID=113226 RepID=A0A139IF73_9PEZI|nr:hypothetical protein AC579_7246 [Pseudocercospora musae]